jgi:hypothetical protein
MTKLTLTSERKNPLKPMIESATQNEIKLLESGIQKTEKRLKSFETRYGSPKRFLNGIRPTSWLKHWISMN